MTVTIFEHRREQFRQLYNHFTSSHPHDRFRAPEHEDDLVFLAKLRVIPARNTNYSIDKVSDTWDYHTTYKLQLFVSTLEAAIIEENLTESQVRDELNKVEDRLSSHPNRDYPADGSKGQAKTAMMTTRDAYRWLLGEFHGYDLHEDDYL